MTQSSWYKYLFTRVNDPYQSGHCPPVHDDVHRLLPGYWLYCEGRHKPLLRGVSHGVFITIFYPFLIYDIIVDGSIDKYREILAVSLALLGTSHSL